MGSVVSIIIPIYKVERYLRACLDSVVGQTYKSLEIILVDDGSPDNCGAICDEYARKDSRIQVIHKKNEGVSVARNVGIEAACGDWVMFVDPDDWIEAELCEVLMRAADEQHSDVIYSQIEGNSEDGMGIVWSPPVACSRAVDRSHLIALQVKLLVTFADSEQFMMGGPVAKLFRRELLENKACRFPEGLKRRQDAIFNLMVLEFAQTGYFVGYAGYHYRMRDDSVCHRYDPQMIDYILGYCHAAAAIVEKYHAGDPVYEQKLGSGIINSYSEIARICCFHKESTAGFEAYKDYICRFYNDPYVKKYIKKGKPSDYPRAITRIKCWSIKYRLIYLSYVLFWLREKTKKQE